MVYTSHLVGQPLVIKHGKRTKIPKHLRKWLVRWEIIQMVDFPATFDESGG